MKSQPIVRFVAVGLLVLLIENCTIWILTQSLNSFLVARTISTLLAVLLAYLLNTKYTFSSAYNLPRFVSYLYGVALSASISYFVSLGVYYLVFSSRYPLLATNIGAVIAAYANFIYQRNITYKRIS